MLNIKRWYEILLPVLGILMQTIAMATASHELENAVSYKDPFLPPHFKKATRLKMKSDLIQINYAKATEIAALLNDKKSSLLSSQGRLAVDKRTNLIWIKDHQAQLNEIKALVKRLDVPVKQVLIEARIVNVRKDVAQDLGLHFNIANARHLSLQANSSQPQDLANNTQTLAQRLQFDLTPVPVIGAALPMGLTLAKLDNNILLDLELAALESEGRGKIISKPRLLTLDQQTAFIESGEEVPYQEATLSGATAVAFKKAVLSLKVTPQVTANNKILMDLQLNQNTLSAKVFNGVPAILTKEVHTNALVANGQTIVLGGICKQDNTRSVHRVPFLGKLPFIGLLFRKQSRIIKNEELLIFITPRIIASLVRDDKLTLAKKTSFSP